MRKGIGALTLVLLLATQVDAGLFDDRFPSARVIGMGGSGVAVNTGVWASYYNPAALSQVQRTQFGTAFQRLYNLGFFKNYFGAAAYPLSEKFGSVSVSLQYFGVEYQNVQLSTETTLALSHGIYLLRDVHSSLALGYSIKGYHWSLGESVEGVNLGSSTVLGIDVGLQASIYTRTSLGVYLLNLNSPQIGDATRHDLPQRIVVGIAYQPYDGVTTSLDMNRVVGLGEMEIWGGAEFRVFKMVLLRFGGTTNPNRFSAGVGVEFSGFQVDYGLRTHSELGETHQFGLMYSM